jgi:hypothetical protein
MGKKTRKKEKNGPKLDQLFFEALIENIIGRVHTPPYEPFHSMGRKGAGGNLTPLPPTPPPTSIVIGFSPGTIHMQRI